MRDHRSGTTQEIDFGPGCERHKGCPHNLCPECWKLEPDPPEVEIVNLSLDAYMDNGGR